MQYARLGSSGLKVSRIALGMMSYGSKAEREWHLGTVRSGTDPLAGELYGDDDFDVVDAVRAVAAERGLPPARIALAWLLGKPAVTAPIVGATKPRHLEDAIAAVEVTLRDEEVARLQSPCRPHPVLGHS